MRGTSAPRRDGYTVAHRIAIFFPGVNARKDLTIIQRWIYDWIMNSARITFTQTQPATSHVEISDGVCTYYAEVATEAAAKSAVDHFSATYDWNGDPEGEAVSSWEFVSR